MKFLAVIALFVFSLSSFAQNHMVEFNADAIMLGSLTHSKSKSKNESTDEQNSGLLFVNVARTISNHWQFAIQGNYQRVEYSSGDYESYGALLGGILNLNQDFRESFYVGFYAGMNWIQDRQLEIENDEMLVGRIAIGKRIPLSFLSLDNVTYSPEISFTSNTATKATSNDQWSQDLAIKYLQFSVFF